MEETWGTWVLGGDLDCLRFLVGVFKCGGQWLGGVRGTTLILRKGSVICELQLNEYSLSHSRLKK